MTTAVGKIYLLPAVTGFLLILCFPKISQEYAAWFALVPLCLFLERNDGVRSCFFGALFAGGIAYFALLIWMAPVLVRYGHLPSALAWLLYGLVVLSQSLFFAVACAMTRMVSNRLRVPPVWVLPWAWIASEWLRGHIPFGGLPWLQIGYSQTGNLMLMQTAAVTGVYGVSFLILWINASLAHSISTGLRSVGGYASLSIGITLLAIAWIHGSVELIRWSNVPHSRQAALLQQNIGFNEDAQLQIWKLQEGYAWMAERIGPGQVDLLVLPESPSYQVYQEDASYRQAMQGLARKFPLGLVFNNTAYVRDVGVRRDFNSAFLLDRNGELRGRYDKIHLVPFGEYIPLKKLFFFAESITQDVSEFSPGTVAQPMEVGRRTAGVIICFEAIFPHLVRRFAEQGAELLINLTNDAWYGDSAAPYQHLDMARWRAVENRRFMLRAANSGISAIIDPTGEILTQTALLRQEICTGPFGFVSSQSFYTRHGDVFAALCAIITVGLCALSLRPQPRGQA